MTVLWEADPTAVERFRLALGGDIHLMESPAMVGRALQENPSLALVVIGPEVSLDLACDLAESVRLDRPELGVILIRHRLEVTSLAQALRSGVREVVAADDMTTLADAVRRSRELTARMAGHVGIRGGQEGKIVTVFSAKGGVGKTTFATNIGAHLAMTGHKALLVDMDLAFGDVGISLQLMPKSTMMDVVAMSGHLDEQGLKSLVTRHHASGLDTLCAPTEPSDADRIPSHSVSEVLRVARRHYDAVIIDTPPAFTEQVLASFDLSDVMILIATLDIPAVKNLRLTMETLDLLGTPRERRLVVLNRSDAKVGLRAEDVVTAIKQDIIATVPNSSDVPASVNRGVPLMIEDPRHPVSAALRRLSDDHIRPLIEPEGSHDDGRRRGLGLLRGRR
jgi:pilus assembly protein CpaE